MEPVPSADRSSARWHVSPLVDLLAYQFSWLWILVPLALSGDQHPKDYLGLWAVGMTLSFLHRYFTMPYVYLDKAVFSQHVTRFTLFMGLVTIGGVASAFLYSWRGPKGFLRPVDIVLVASGALVIVQAVVADKRGAVLRLRTLAAVAAPFLVGTLLGIVGAVKAAHVVVDLVVVAGFAAASVLLSLDQKRTRVFAIVSVVLALGAVVAAMFFDIKLNTKPVQGNALVGVVGAFAALWNVWHTLMQKFGILRLYAAKSGVALERRTPAWVDRFLIFGSLPLVALWVGPAQRDTLEHQAKSVTQYLMPILDVVEMVQPFLLVPAALLAAASIGVFLFYEKRADGLRSWPRLSMAAALTLLNATFFFLSPLKVYIAYGFSHALEYMVFVWAFLRRRYAQPIEPRPLLQRLLTRPALAYGIFCLVVGGTYFVIQHGRDYGLHDGRLSFFGPKVGTWLFSFAIWHSITHFYFDGFLWKMRAPSVRAHL